MGCFSKIKKGRETKVIRCLEKGCCEFLCSNVLLFLLRRRDGRQRKLFFMIWDPCCGSEQYFIFDEKLYALPSSFLHPIYMLNSFLLLVLVLVLFLCIFLVGKVYGCFFFVLLMQCSVQ